MGVLLMAMTIGGLILAAILFAVAIYTKKIWLSSFVFGGVVVWFMFYFAMLSGFSVVSEEKNLGLNEPKQYCGFYLDCHMHAAVTSITTAKSIGNKIADGEFYIVRVKVSSNAKAATLGLNTVDAHVVDGEGRRYDRDIDAESGLSPQPGFEEPVSPFESFEKEIVFDLPAGIRNPRLDIREGQGIERMIQALLVGDEDSVFHKRTYFSLAEPAPSVAVK